ncbi:MAG: hypothetical protein LUD27_07795 [Clostridia bacterium]|nr:hypothetical protein [Clostridia bacterium]
MDWSCNHSFFGQSDYCSVKQKYSGREKVSSDKHYLCIAVSDGDNVQWLERNFMTDGHFGQRCRSNKGYKLNWTVAPSMGKLCPEVLQKIYSMANNDYFITGVSGIGYTNTMSYPYKYLSEYSALTEEAMKVSDLNYMCLLDNFALTSDEENVTKRLDEFAKYDRIGGGIWELDPDRYESGKGRVFWSSNGKPFVSVRLSMWHPSNDPDQTNDEWIKSYADKINSMPVCPDKIDGYTVLNVHPWTVNINQLNYFVSLLSENVEILFVKDFIEEIKKNVPHVNAVPEN